MQLPQRFEGPGLNLTLQMYNQYRTTYPAVEIIGGMLYDVAPFVSGGAGTLRAQFFNVARATPNLTNLPTPGVLTNNQGFLIRALRFLPHWLPRSTARAAAGNVQPGCVDDMAQILNTGVFRLNIGSKPYAEIPLWMIPGGGGVFPISGSDGDTADPGNVQDWATNGVPSSDNAFTLSQPLFLQPLVNFDGLITWPAVITLANGNSNIQVCLDGDQMRPVQ